MEGRQAFLTHTSHSGSLSIESRWPEGKAVDSTDRKQRFKVQ